MTTENQKTPTGLTIRPSTAADVAAIQAIYADAVLHGTGTFETEVPGIEEISRRRDEVLSRSLPWLVAKADGQVIGYAYANYFRPRLAYRFCLEDSVYLRPDQQGRGVGKLLLGELISRCEAAGARQMLAVIGDSDFAANSYLGIQGNKDLFVNTVNWLAQQENLIAIRPKEASDRRVTLTAGQQSGIFWLALLLIPVAALGAGVYTWSRRR